MEHLLTTDSLISFFTLTLMEVVLGIDNVVFISIVSGKLPKAKQPRARKLGLILAIIPRVLLLLGIYWIIKLTKPLIVIEQINLEMTGKGLILLIGGLFLLYSSTMEIHHKLEGEHVNKKAKQKGINSFGKAMIQILLLNIVFSFDSVLTAVGLAKHIEIMIVAVLVSTLIMLLFAGAIANFVNKHPTIKILALSFLLMIGLLLVAEAFEVEVPKGYVYFAMGFSLFVEMLNLRVLAKSNPQPEPVKLKDTYDVEL